MTLAPDPSSLELAERLGASARVMSVTSSVALSSCLHEVRLRGDAALVAGVAGNDVMIRLTDDRGRAVRRRYSVRGVDPERDELTLWITSDHDGPGVRWAGGAQEGDVVDVIGPRGKIVLDPLADWHLFVGDLSALGAFYRLAQSVEVPGKVIFIVEIDHADDALTAPFDEGLGVTGIFVDRQGRASDDPAGLLKGLAAFAFPPDEGHAYLFGEFHVLKALAAALRDRGLRDEAISVKSFWRQGHANADHGEPRKD
ncbi:MAG: SIP domain-containing protein [Acidobacteriota bacterium]|nr:SIP domain-containing protein [Acidobacteriota bacterium]MDE3044119.1 SIP domain-containing protein [Acidobacteriota bacterium]MDE3223195.1 SIP domain-containing protein [Acidobacteriota bacterium]